MRLALAALLLASSLPPARADTAASPLAGVRRTVLANGLTVLLLEDHSAPLVSVGIMYAAGARNESAGVTGVAHFVEHMNFRASARFPGSENTEAITRIGGRWNGYTWIDQTYYAATVPRGSLGLVLDIEADRMSAALFDPREFERERKSVIAELHSYDDPQSVLYDAVLTASFELHPYRNNTIGWLTDVEQITRAQAWSFYRRFYHPGNAVLALVGDFQTEHALAEVERRFARVAWAGESSAVRSVEPPQTGQRRVTVRRRGPHAQVLLAWRAPALAEADFPTMVLFDALVAGGKGFRFTREYPAPADVPLERALVGSGLATQAASDWQASRYPYVYTLAASVAESDGLDEAEAALWKLVAEAGEREWSHEELRRARRQVRTGWAADLDDLAGRVHQLAFFEVSGGHDHLTRMPAALERVTREDLRRFARERLRPERATVGWFVPVDEEQRAVDSRQTPVDSRQTPADSRPSTVEGRQPPAERETSRRDNAPGRASTFSLANGVRVTVVPRSGAGLVALRARFDVGALHDERQRALLPLLVEALSRPAAGERPGTAGLAFTLHEEPTAFTNFRWIEVAAQSLQDDLPETLEALAGRLRAASAPPADEQWRSLVEAAAERARAQAASPETALWARAVAELYPARSPLALPAWGAEGTLVGARRETVADLVTAHLQPRGGHLVLAGAVDADALRPALQRTLGRWTASGRSRSGPAAIAPLAPARGPAQWTERVISVPAKAQNDILVAWPGERRGAEDRAATDALLYLLGETGYAGRLGRALVEPGLVYSVYASLEEAPRVPGFLMIRTAASRTDTPEVLRRVRTVLEKAAREGFTQAELDEAKAYLRGKDALRREGSLDAAQAALEDAVDPPAFDPQRLTLHQLNATAREMFARGAPLALVMGPGMPAGGQ